MGSSAQQTTVLRRSGVPDNWNFNASNPCLHAGGNYSQNLNHGLFYVNYNTATNANANIGCRVLVKHFRLQFLLVRGPHPFHWRG